jgi:diguanylate cyclase (GGDEF)-like protein/PAS domain S-box-containing protein
MTEGNESQTLLAAVSGLDPDLFRVLVAEGSDVIVVRRPDQRLSFVSESVERVLGYSPEEFADSAWDHVHPDDLPLLTKIAKEVRKAPGARASMELRIQHADGTWRWFELRGLNLLDDPTINGVVSNLRDVNDRRLAEDALRDSEARFRSVTSGSPIGIYEMDSTPVLRFVNERWTEITGFQDRDALGQNWQAIIHPDDRAMLAEQWRLTGAAGQPFLGMLRVVRPDGEIRWVMAATEPLEDAAGVLTGHVGTLDDITDRLTAQRDTERLSEIVEATSDLVLITGRDSRVMYMNSAAKTFFDLGSEDVLEDFDFRPFSPAWVQERYMTETRPTLKKEGIWSGELAYLRHGREVPVSALFLAHHDPDGNIEFVSSVTRDISERKHYEARLEYQATHDHLTGLPNRTLFLDRLELAIARGRRSHRSVAVLFCDVDHFKVVNDSLGHSAGDRLLVAVADRLRSALRPGDTVARFGGDEFVILCDDLDHDHDAVTIAERVHVAVHEPPLTVENTEVFAAVSIGISFSHGDKDPETMIRDADAAMYLAKARGRARYEIYDERLRSTLVERLDIETALRRALTRHELRVVYQPTIDLASGRIVGVEALLRWEHPERGQLVPAEFMDVAEETGLIVPIGAWVVDQACRQAQRWHTTADGDELFVSVNLSSRQLESAALIEDIASVLKSTAIEPGRLGLEITESVVMRDPEASTTALRALKDLGVRLAVDDFGTGYSSLAYLRRFPVDLLKVDQAFVDGLGRDPEDSAIVAAVVSLAHTLGMKAIAEGVETAEQLHELRALGCDMAQGFYMARPLAPADLDDLLAAAPSW